MLLSGFAACFLLVVLMRPTSPSSQHRSCMKFQNTSVFQGPANLKAGPDYKITVINPNDIVYFRATELSWGSNNKRSRYNVESDFEPELLSSDNSAERSNSKEQTKWIEFSARTLHALDILKDKFKSLSLDTTVEEIWPEYDHYYADYYGSKEGSYIGGESDVVLKFQNGQNQDLEPFQPGDRIEANYKGQGEWYPAKFDGEHDTPGFYKVTYDDLPNREGRTKKEDVRHMAKHDYLVFGKYYNPLNKAPCQKCDGDGKVPGRMWGTNTCRACRGWREAKRYPGLVDAFIDFLEEKGIEFTKTQVCSYCAGTGNDKNDSTKPKPCTDKTKCKRCRGSGRRGDWV